MVPSSSSMPSLALAGVRRPPLQKDIPDFPPPVATKRKSRRLVVLFVPLAQGLSSFRNFEMQKKLCSFSLIERVILSAGAMLILCMC